MNKKGYYYELVVKQTIKFEDHKIEIVEEKIKEDEEEIVYG